jgi:hypothetical protein
MPSAPRDVAQIRLDNAMRLFDEFVSATVKHPDAATLRGLERRFAERLQIQPSYWSQIKSRSRQIGERLARQFEQLCHKQPGWMDIDHGGGSAAVAASNALPSNAPATAESSLPQDDDERFIVGLVLTYYVCWTCSAKCSRPAPRPHRRPRPGRPHPARRPSWMSGASCRRTSRR